MSTTRVISNWKYHFQHFGRLYLVIHTGRTVFWTASVAERTRLNPNIAWVYLQTKYPLSCQNIRKKWTHTRKSFCDFHVGYRGSLIPNFGTFIFSKNLVYRTKQVCTCVSCTLCTVDLIRLWSGVSRWGYTTTAPFTQAGILYLYLFSWQKGGIEGGTKVIGAAKVHMKKALIWECQPRWEVISHSAFLVNFSLYLRKVGNHKHGIFSYEFCLESQ